MKQQISYQAIESIHPYENNPRNNAAAVDLVAKSIKDFGFRVPILIDQNDIIIAGHTRYEAAKKLGLKEVPCVKVTDLTDAQIRAYRIADNKTAEASSWDDDLLKAEMEALQGLGIDLESTGFTDVEVESVLRDIQDEDFEEFFVEPVNKPTASAEQHPPEDNGAAPPAPAPRTTRIQCPKCGEWIDL